MERSRVIPPFTAVLLMVALSLLGIVCIPHLKVQYLPTSKEGSLLVSWTYLDASAEVVEAEVTSRLEGVLAGIRGCTDVSSVSRNGEGSVTMTFRKGTDMEAARFATASAIRNVYSSLPNGLSYPAVSRAAGSASGRTVLTYTVKGAMPSQEIERYVRERLLAPLSALKGVDRVSLTGATPFHWVITFDAGKAASVGVDAREIAEAIRHTRSGALLGMVQTPDGKMAARLAGDPSADFGSIPVKNVGGQVVYLGDIASWRYEETEPSAYYRVNGLNTVNLSIGLEEDANLLVTNDAVRKRMDLLQAAFPDGITASVTYDASDYVRDELRRIFLRTGLCLLILLLFVLLVSRSWRYLLVVAATLSVNVLSAIALYAFAGLPVHIYTLAGITVSLGIIIDTTIVMANHYVYRKDRKVFPDILSATATTVSALLAMFLLPEGERANLTDFIWVIVLNLALSLAVAWLFIPSLLSLFPLSTISGNRLLRPSQAVRFNRRYASYVRWGARHRWLLLVLAAAAFAWPAWRFSKALDRSDFYRVPAREQLCIRAAMPEGCTIGQLNDVVRSMENYLAGFDGIETFTTRILSYDDARIDVTFTPEAEKTSFPLELKAAVTAMAIRYGGATWQVWGVDENAFSNDVVTTWKSNRITLTGYQYQDLVRYAEKAVEHLSENRRVSGPEIWSGNADNRPRTEFNISYDFGRMVVSGVDPYTYHAILASRLWDADAGSVITDGVLTGVVLRSSDAEAYDLWHVLNEPVDVDGTKVTLSNVGTVVKEFSGRDILRNNQSYQVDVRFDFIGSNELGRKVIDETVAYLNEEVLPVGFKAEGDALGWFHLHKERYYWLIGLILAILYVLLSVTFESFRLSWPVLAMVPVSFVGLFLVFGFTSLGFDQGGFAAFVMLSGLVVNAGIYLGRDWQRSGGDAACSLDARIHLYVKSFSRKIVPISLTILSTVLGLLPFLSDGPEEVFWFDFAVGTIGGLLFSVAALLLLFPPLLVGRRKYSPESR